ncbi:MAG: sugar kinase [Clostridiales bacterium]|jgi:2-dehydro-3-deoxygluconokinase|nr:sugar kinase [Clostridiales bacterium]
MSQIVTFGEVMMRLQTPLYKRFAQADGFDMCFGGGEANVAVGLAGFGADAAFFSKLPENELADACVAALKARGVETRFLLRGGERMGIYFCEKGAAQRPSKIIYDRKGSSINDISEDEIDIERLFDGTKWFHFSGITAALSEKTLNALRVLIAGARERCITVSCDLNYRKKLWSREKAREVMTELVGLCDVLISNEEECKDIFGIEAAGADIDGGVVDPEAYAGLAAALRKKFKNLTAIAFTLRTSVSASVNRWACILSTKDGCFVSKRYEINIVDRIGAGDSFSAGLIFSLLNKKSPREAVEFAAAASCLKHTVEGDFSIATAEEVEALIKSGGGGRVQR